MQRSAINRLRLLPAKISLGEERLLAAVRANASLSAKRLAKAIAEAAHDFGGKEQDDDLTLLVARAC